MKEIIEFVFTELKLSMEEKVVFNVLDILSKKMIHYYFILKEENQEERVGKNVDFGIGEMVMMVQEWQE